MNDPTLSADAPSPRPHPRRRRSPRISGILGAPWLPAVGGLVMLLLGIAFFVYDEGREGFSELDEWFAWVEFFCFGPGMALLVYVLLAQLRRRELYFARRLAIADKEHLLYLGHLAAGVAHEVRNPLHNMRLIVDRLGDPLDDDSRERWHLRLAANLERVEAAVGLVFQQARQPDEEIHETLDLRDAVDSAAREVGGPVRWETESPSGRRELVTVPPEALRVILENLLRNARDAAVGPSLLRLESNGERVHLLIRNRGELNGVSPPTRPRTHLGIGLSLCRLLAQRFDAHLALRQSGPWVEATLDLPAWAEDRA
ncbi:MAG: HAMP domain-containing sensor histidine kinase [Thermoanaerobaculia bacterium]|nr:HAMP domain-containing sensor histidine kinase [Thermoanaerobaculia bacterium]